jgi:phosphohistidine phosphatase
MRLYVIRHAIAAPKSKSVPDAARPLTKKGRERFEEAARGLEALGARFDRLYHSPKLRAVETAELVASLVKRETRVTANLAKPPMPELLAEWHGHTVAVVGHQPYLGALVAWLVTGTRRGGPKFEMKKGAVIVLDGRPEPGGMRLVESLPPRVLRHVSGK